MVYYEVYEVRCAREEGGGLTGNGSSTSGATGGEATNDLAGLMLGHGTYELTELYGRRGMFPDVCLRQFSVHRIAGGNIEGDVQVGAGVGGSLALAELGDVGQLVLHLTEEALLALLLSHEMGTDEHQG